MLSIIQIASFHLKILPSLVEIILKIGIQLELYQKCCYLCKAGILKHWKHCMDFWSHGLNLILEVILFTFTIFLQKIYFDYIIYHKCTIHIFFRCFTAFPSNIRRLTGIQKCVNFQTMVHIKAFNINCFDVFL